MVRFSDMLGGNADSEGARATVPAPAATDTRPEPEPDDAPATQSPEDVLDRLTQYATSARFPEPPAVDDTGGVEATPPNPTDEPLTPIADDLLPRARGEGRKRRRK